MRSVDVDWSAGAGPSTTPERLVRLRVTSEDSSGLLKLMSEVFSTLGVNIQNAQARTTRDLRAVCIFDIRVRNTKQLNEVIRDLEKLPGVTNVVRTSLSSS